VLCAPTGDQSLAHPKRVERFGIPSGLINEAAFSTFHRHGLMDRFMRQKLIEQSSHRHDPCPSQRQITEPGMDQKHQPEKKRHPGQIKKSADGRTTHETAHQFQIAHRLCAGIDPGPATDRACAQGKAKRLIPHARIQTQ